MHFPAPLAHHSTTGRANCKQCIHEGVRATRAKQKAAKEAKALVTTMVSAAAAATNTPTPLDAVSAYLAAMALKAL